MFTELMVAVLLGMGIGIITGLLPGVHVNLVSVLLVTLAPSLPVAPLSLAVFIVCLGLTHTFLDAVPSIFLGAPDEDKVMAVLPGHRMLLQGEGYQAVKLTTWGSYACLLVTLILIPLSIPILPSLYGWIEPFMGYFLVAVILWMILAESGMKKLWALVIFLLSGALGLTVFELPLQQPLFPMLSGLFGASSLLLSESSKIPPQHPEKEIKLSKSMGVRTVGAGVFSGALTGLFPGLGAAQASVIGMALVGNIGIHGFLALVGGIGTVNFIFSLAALYALNKARNGAIVAVMQIVGGISFLDLLILLACSLLAGSVAVMLTLWCAKRGALLLGKIDYQKVSRGILLFISVLVLLLTSWLGMLVFIVSTCVGLLAPQLEVKRSYSMGCLLVPVMLYFL
ncbi:MAG: tripartite tricarboxylate transporter permease [Nanoarchaeota archaeon]|nr:tripartite tricarboxylate transporter permease [Nanoarchaeota archaeon]